MTRVGELRDVGRLWRGGVVWRKVVINRSNDGAGQLAVSREVSLRLAVIRCGAKMGNEGVRARRREVVHGQCA